MAELYDTGSEVSVRHVVLLGWYEQRSGFICCEMGWWYTGRYKPCVSYVHKYISNKTFSEAYHFRQTFVCLKYFIVYFVKNVEISVH
jgi:hypothetical protein